MLEAIHGDAFATERHAFEFQTCPLFPGGVAAELDLSAGADDAMPGQVVDREDAQKACDRAVIPRVASGCGDSSVGADLAWGDREDHALEGDVAQFIRARRVAEEVSPGPLGRELIHGRDLRCFGRAGARFVSHRAVLREDLQPPPQGNGKPTALLN